MRNFADFIEYFVSGHPSITIFFLILMWIFLIIPNKKTKKRQMDNWGVTGYKVWWRLMTFQKSNNTDDGLFNRIYLGLFTIFLVGGTFFTILANMIKILI